ncbi:MAG: hypothetical protein C9356_02745 [Oleiphilus sp.]|nr:MAG: hypothetical protein C9356_02745 [Oleiphilus sp.]
MSLNALSGPEKDCASLGMLMKASAMEIDSRITIRLIEETAKIIVADQIRPAYLPGNFDSLVNEQLTTWIKETLPQDHHLVQVLADVDHFLDLEFHWQQVFSFGASACPDASGRVVHYREELTYFYDAIEEIDEELVEDFYAFWRSRFYVRILSEYRSLSFKQSPENKHVYEA